MCGIAGILSQTSPSPDTLQAMTSSLAHRGPDAQGIFFPDVCCGVGHRRLTIIDLSDAANQPMRSEDGDLTLIFNGEIYNFQNLRKELIQVNPSVSFRTNSDSETILHAFAQWGTDMLNKLEGMFAMAIYDQCKKQLFLFRDRIGKKPLFYYESDTCFVFASEIKSLLKHPEVATHREVNINSFHRFLHLGYIPQPDTIFKSIKKFPQGSWGVKSLGNPIKIREFWSPAEALSKPVSVPKNVNDLKNTLRASLHKAVTKRLVGDVPIGSFLSGGTDSSLITAIAAQYRSGQLNTFSIGFRESKFDESRYAEQVAKHLNTNHHSYVLEEADALDILETYIHHFDEPFADTSAIPTMLVSQLTRKDVKVALTGDGGDELFLGYGAYNWARRLNNPVVKIFQNPASNLLRAYGGDRLKRIGRMLEKVDDAHRPSHIFSQEQYFFSQNEVENLLVHTYKYQPFRVRINDIENLSLAEKQAFFDLTYYLTDDLLVKVDRASMFHALECRCPLLDHEVVEIALNIPEKFKIRGGECKWILKELLKEYLPDNLIFRPKWGFSIPLAKWLNGKLGYLIDDYLNDVLIENLGIVRKEVVRQLIGKFKSGEQHLYNRLWVLIVLHKWLKENG